MKITVIAFAALRDALGESRCVVEIPEAGTGADLRETLAAGHPRFRDLIQACRVAKGVDFIDLGVPLSDGDEVVFIPPVSGGNLPPAVLLTTDPLDGNALQEAATIPACGAVVRFEGTVRSPSDGKTVRYLEYEVYVEMAKASMERIVAEAREACPEGVQFLHHSLGRVEVGEVSVVAVASAPHRGQAFDICRSLIEKLKADVPIWKKETFEDGSVWVGAPGECSHDQPAENLPD